jgi:hypothetical protein
MEVVDFWKPDLCCEINTRFHGGRLLEINLVQLPAVRRRLGNLQANSSLLLVRGRSPAQGVSREREYIFRPSMLQLPVGGRRETPSRQLSGLQTHEGDVEKEVAEDIQDYNGKGVLFQPHHSRRVLRGGAPRQDRETAEPQTHQVAVAGPATMEPRSLWPCPNTNSRQQVSQFGSLM